MLDETDISHEKAWLYQERANKVVTNLKRVNIDAQYVRSCREALLVTLEMIPQGGTVARGDSISVDQIGIMTELRKRNQNKIIDPQERDVNGFFVAEQEERSALAREAFFSDIYLTGTNAITMDGKMVNVDGWGNRVAAMVFGPKKVIVVAGANKIVKDVKEAHERIHRFAARMNAKRHFLKHHWSEFADLPCVRTGNCVDCNHGWCMCRYTVIIAGTMSKDKGRINVVLVGEELGI
jgi:hypothetical protein